MTSPEQQATPELARADLLEVYKVAVEEYRFEVRLNWDRTSYLLTLNSLILGAGAGLMQWKEAGNVPGTAALLIAVITTIGILAAWLGLQVQKKGKEYYDRTILKKALIEDLLGLLAPRRGLASDTGNLAIATTHGMGETSAMLSDPDAWLRGKRFRLFRRTILAYTGWLFVAFMVIDATLLGVALLAITHGGSASSEPGMTIRIGG